jgi:DNA polymerase/3'-5' exonuclease PolX
MFIPYDQYFPALLHFTGSGFFNNQLRSYAIEKGFHLSEFSLTQKGDSHPLKVSSEKDIFDYLKVDYLKPEERSL